jgi:hypothetical protein
MQRLTLFAAATAVLAAASTAAQPAKTPVAKIAISGTEVETLTVDNNGKKERFVLLEIDAKTTVKVQTDQDVDEFNEKMLAEFKRLFEEFKATAKALVAKNDIEGLKKARKDHEAASKELQDHLHYYVADGTLTVVAGELRLAGQLRPFAYKGADKALGKGKARVEGEATRVMFDAGQGAKMTLAIQNDAQPIVLTGKVAQDMVNVKGVIRAHGVLRLDKGGIVLEAEAIELGKK